MILKPNEFVVEVIGVENFKEKGRLDFSVKLEDRDEKFIDLKSLSALSQVMISGALNARIELEESK